MRRLLIVLVLLFIVPASLVAQDRYAKGEKSITERELKHYVRTLASDRYEGRLSGTKHCDRAAKLLVDDLKKMKLALVPGMDSLRWEFEIAMPPKVERGTKLVITAGSDKKEFDVRKHYVPMPFSANAQAREKVVFAGYGITAPEYGYDDYAGIDAKGKVVIVMRHEPQKGKASSKFKGKEYTKHARFSEKALNAQKHGAAALIFVTDPLNYDRSKSEFRRLRVGKVAGVTIPVVFVRLSVADWLFSRGPKALEYLQKEIDSDCKPRSFEFEKVTIQIRVELTHANAKTYNVMACCKGSDPKLSEEYIVIGAHYDHIGRGLFGLEGQYSKLRICNGADDNASGTAAVMEIAEAFGLLKEKPKRSVIFVLFSGEERGLLGSRALVENPPVPLEKIACMINFDMIGRSRGLVYVSGVGSAAEFSNIVHEANREIRMPLKVTQQIGGGSDHLPFYKKKIPILYFLTGMHKDYHRPTDDWEKINFEDMEKITRLAFRVSVEIANLPKRPKYTEASHAADRVPYLGIQAEDMPESSMGARIKKVTPGSPAEKGGLKAGDVVVKFGGRVVLSVADIKGLLFQKAQGDEIEVTVLRNEEEVQLKVKLGKKKDF